MTTVGRLLHRFDELAAALVHRQTLERLDAILGSDSVNFAEAAIKRWSPLAAANDGLDLTPDGSHWLHRLSKPDLVELMLRLTRERGTVTRVLKFSDLDAIHACRVLDMRNAYDYLDLTSFGEYTRTLLDDDGERFRDIRDQLVSGKNHDLETIDYLEWCDRLVVSNSGTGHRISALASLCDDNKYGIGETFEKEVTVVELDLSVLEEVLACATPYVVVATNDW